ncbi:MAG: glycoside hydrolase family 55 protein [Planctomycetota bacterium]|jgi:hypothetical protein|nr:glycoside hydrolase family 55 protein [Planctomycetota bacterium]
MSRTILALVAISLALGAAEVPDFIPPANSGVINVRDHGAVGDGVADDTAVIRAAITAAFDRDNRYAAPPMVYLPAGTYRITDSIASQHLKKGWSSGWLSGSLIKGQHRDKTIIKLDDNAPGFGDAKKPRFVMATGSEADGGNDGGGGNRAFRHAIMNLTVDVGSGNPGAVAVDLVVSNRGTLEDAVLRAGPDSGWCGLRMDRWWPGPGLIKNVRIEGFAQGIRMAGHWQYSMTFDQIELIGQRDVGLLAEHNPVFAQRMRFEGPAQAIRITEGDHLLVLLDSEIIGSDGATGAAIRTEGIADIRDLRCSGFQTIIDGRGDNNLAAKNAKRSERVERWAQGTQVKRNGKSPEPLNLKVEQTPRVFPGKKDWVDGSGDLQSALDQGGIVYLPQGNYDIKQTLVVRDNVQALIGFQSSLRMVGEGPVMRIENKRKAVVLEHLWFEGTIEHVGTGSVALRHCDVHKGKFMAIGRGKTFIEDVIGRYEVGAGHKLWARQTNAEFGEEPLLINRGGAMWLLGFKTEGEMVCIEQESGATELLGGFFYPLRDVPGNRPAIDLKGGSFAGSWVYNGKHYPVHVREGETDHRGDWGRGPALWSTGR